MARVAKKQKAVVVPRKSSKTSEEKHIGREITNWTNVTDVESAMRECLHHYNYFYDYKDAVKWTTSWIKKNMTKQDLAYYQKAEAWRTSITVGGICKMIENGAQFDDHRLNWLRKKVEEIIAVGKAKKEDAPKVSTGRSPADIVKERTSEFIACVEEVIDMFGTDTWVDWENYSVYNELKSIDAPYNTAKAVADYYIPLRDEIKELVEEKTADLLEAYGYMGVRERKQYLKVIQGIIDDAEKYMASKKAVRKPRVKKTKTASQQTSKLKYAQDSAEYKVVSVDPTNIIMANEVYLFNTKYRTLTYLVSNAARGFEIKGTTIQNIDMEASSKKTLRKPDEVLTEFSKITKAKAKKTFTALKTKSSVPNGRVNEDTIILKVFS